MNNIFLGAIFSGIMIFCITIVFLILLILIDTLIVSLLIIVKSFFTKNNVTKTNIKIIFINNNIKSTTVLIFLMIFSLISEIQYQRIINNPARNVHMYLDKYSAIFMDINNNSNNISIVLSISAMVMEIFVLILEFLLITKIEKLDNNKSENIKNIIVFFGGVVFSIILYISYLAISGI